VLITKENVDTYSKQIDAITQKIKDDLTTKYLTRGEATK
jgi:hypothetical protein